MAKRGRRRGQPTAPAAAAVTPDNVEVVALTQDDPLEQSADYQAKLTPMQAAFVREMMRDPTNQAQAAVKAGYSEHTAASQACRLLKKVNVASALTLAREELARVAGLDTVWVLGRLKDISDRASQAVPVMDANGEPTGEWRFDSNGANKATELIGKHLGLFKDKLQVEIRLTHEEALTELE